MHRTHVRQPVFSNMSLETYVCCVVVVSFLFQVGCWGPKKLMFPAKSFNKLTLRILDKSLPEPI